MMRLQTPRTLLLTAAFILVAGIVSFTAGRVAKRTESVRSANSVPVFAPNVVATKSATLGNDVNGNGFVNPGDTLMYSVVVGNTGMDAMSVVFTDQLNAGLTLMGTATASPIATNDSYTSIGNVGITVPAGSGLLANDVSPDNTSVSVSAVNTAGTQGTVIFNANGSFTFMPAAGFEGTTTFGYTLTSSNTKTNIGTVTITVSGMIWFIDNNSANGDGRLGTPFSSIANFNTGASDDPGDNIFVYRQTATNYTGSSLTLLANQKLIGQGATASLATITGISLPTFSNALPSTGGTRPVLTNTNTTVTLSTGNTIRGVDLQNTTAGSALIGTSFNNLTISETTVTSANATAAVNLDQGSGTAAINVTLISVSANTCTNGIVLADTTGSFSVNGDGSNTSLGGNNSGGVISNTSGADGVVAGSGVYLSNVQSVSLRRMQINDHPNWAIRGLNVNGFNLEYATVNSTASGTSKNGNNAGLDEGSIFFGTEGPGTTGLIGTANITNCIIEDGLEDNFKIANTSGTLSQLTMTGTTIRDTSVASPGNVGFGIRVQGTANVTVDITTCTFVRNRARGFQVTSTPDSTGTIDVEIGVMGNAGSGSTFTDNNISVDFAHGGQGTMNFDAHHGTYSSAGHVGVFGAGAASPINVNMAASPSGTGPMNGSITNNMITNANSLTGPGMKIETNGTDGDGSNVLTVLVQNNNISQVANRGLDIGTVDGNSKMNITVIGNTITLTDPLAAQGIFMQSGGVSTDTTQVCAKIGGSTAGEKNTIAVTNGDFNIRVRNRFAGTVFNLQGLPGAPTANTTDIANYIATQNNLDAGTVTDNVSVTVNSNNFGACTPPAPSFAPIETEEQLKQQSRNTAQAVGGNSAKPGFFTQVRQWLNPVFSAFAAQISYVKLDRAFSKAAEAFVPAVTAAEKPEDTGNGSGRAPAAVPAKTMIVNSRGETRIVPTASLAAMAGETITINGAGSGFTLPAGESTTVMFNAQISSSYTVPSISNQASVSGSGFGPILSNNQTTDVIQPPFLAKSFSPSNIATNGTATLQFALLNTNNSQSLSQVTFTDVLPVGLNVADGTQSACGGTVTRTAATRTIALSGGSLAVGPPCTFNVSVTAGTTEGTLTNTTGAPDSLESDPGTAATANINVINAPTFTKAFGSSTVALNGTTSLTFTITNNSALFSLSGIGFTDTLPAGLVVATPNGLSTTCSGTATAAGSSISLTGGSLAANASCTITVNVTGTTTGAKDNSATLATTELGASSAATGTVTLTVFAPPTVSKFFVNPAQGNSNNTSLNGTARLAIAITNPPGNPGSLNGLAISDTFPPGIEVDSPVVSSNTCGGTFAPSAGATSISLSGGGPLTPANQCTIFVVVKATVTGAIVNTTGNVSSTEGGAGLTASGTLNVFAPPTVAKAFGTGVILPNAVTTMTFTVTNPAGNPGNLTGVGFSDTLTGGLQIAAMPNAVQNNCGGATLTGFTAASTSLSVSNATVATATPCTITVNVTSPTAGTITNTATSVTSTNGGAGANSNTAMLQVGNPPAITKSFSPAAIKTGATSTMTISITNNNAGLPFNGASFTDTLPAGLTVPDAAATPACGGTLTVASNVITLTGATIATGGGVCTTTFTVTGATAGVKNNTVTVDTTNFGTGFTGTGTITVYDPPTISKSFSPTSITFGGTSLMTFTLTNPNTFAGGGLSGLSFTDTLPAGLTQDSNSMFTICGGTMTLSAPSTVSFSGGALNTSPNSCTINVLVAGAQIGMWPNTTSAISSTQTGAGATSNTATLTVTKVLSTTTITADTPDPSVTGQAYSVAANVVATPPGMGTPTGTINVSDGTGGTCTITLPAASCNLTSTTAGAKTLTATYSGDVNFDPSSDTEAHQVNKADTTLTSLTDSPDPSVVGQAYTVGFTLNVTSPGAGTPTGTVTVSDGAGGTCTATLPATSCQLTSIVAGNKTVTFTYNGDANFNASTATAGHAVNKADTTVAITADTPDPSVFGQNYAVTAAVSVTSPGSGTPSGTITVSDGTDNCTITLPATSCNLPGASVGAKTLTATYNGDANYNGSGPSAGVSHTVNKADVTVTITSDNPDSSAVGQNVTVAFTVAAAAPGAGTPTGTVTVSDGVDSCTGPLSGGSGSCTLALTSAGARTLTATYNGDADFNTGTDTEPHTVVAPPSIAKAFTPPSTPINGTSTLTITITNPAANTVALTEVGFTDNFPANLVVANPLTTNNTCGGTLLDGGGGTLAGGDTGIQLIGGTVNTNSSCTVTVNVTPLAAGPHVNVTSNVSSSNGGNGNTATATLTAVAAPIVAKSFSPTSIVLNGTSTLTINFTNPNSAIALNGLAISDSFPAGLEVNTTPGATNTCGGTFAPTAAATSISLSGGSLAASGSCSISVSVKATTAGAKNNVTGNVSSTESGNGLTASATLNVFAPPTIAKAFSPTTVALNGISTLTITITNPAANPAGVNGVAVSDTFPAGLVVDATPMAASTCGGTFAPVANATSIALTGGTIASAGGSCAISVKVKGTTPGAKPNTTGAVSSTEGGAGLTASATLNVFAPPTVTKAFSPNSIQLNNTSTLTITITNPATNSGGVTGVAISDTFPPGMEVDAAPMATNSCGGTFAPAAAATTINLTGGAIASAGGSCSISVKVKGTSQGLKTNTTGAVSSTEGGAGLTATATLDVITCNSITCPANVFTATTGNSTVVNYPAPTSDGICGTITCTPASGSTFNVGTTTVTCNSSIGNQSCSFDVTVNRVGGTATDPLVCTGPGNTVQATLVIGNNGNVNQLVGDTTTFTNLVGVPGSCTVSPNVGTCAVTNGSLTYGGTLTPGQVVTITYLTQVSDLAPAAAQVCTNNSVTFNGGAPFAFSVCGVVNCPVTGPGLPFPAKSEASDQSAGSVLIYNIFTSSSSAPNSQNTRVSLTNTHPVLSANVHLFFVDGASCSIADSYVCLTGSQTTSFLMSDLDPGTTGYIVAVATDSKGCPINFNYLIGDEYVKFQSGHAANLGAQSYSAIPGGLVACDQNSVTAQLNFDGVSYDRTARTLALDSIGSKADGNDTMLILNRIGGNLGTGAATLNAIFGIFYDDSENSVSFSVAGACQLRSSISNNFPRTTPRFEQFIPAGRTGWMRFFSQSDIGISGAAINFNPNSTSSAGAFNQGHNLHALTLSGAATYTVPVFPPSC